ncbi:MAG: holo-ACP synthase [Candidatus Eremiobacteraeota bacterium]|nr:holo-ACP synthase [Candidatus Eremiobacteraeota bacterium]
MLPDIGQENEGLLNIICIPGVDIVEISRIRKLYEKWGDKFLHRVFTAAEIEYCLGKAGTPAHLAGRFAAKEAVIKSIKVRPSPPLKSIEILRGKSGNPEVRLKKESERIVRSMGILNISLTISHSHDFAVAFAIAHKKL